MADRLEIEVDGQSYRGKGAPMIGFGTQPVRHGGGGRETWPVVRFVEGHITFDGPVSAETLERIKGATVRLHQASGYSMTMHAARAEYAVESPEGVFSLKMVESLPD